MNLLFVTTHFPPTSQGGIESQVVTFARGLPAPHRATVMAPAVAASTNDDDPDAHGVVEGRTRVVRTPLLDPWSPWRGPEPLARLLRRVLETHRVDAVIAHNLHLWFQPAAAAAVVEEGHRAGVPVLLRAHSDCAPVEAGPLRKLPWDRVLCVSRWLVERTVALGVPEDRVGCVPPPIDTDSFRPRDDGGALRRRLGVPDDARLVLHASRIVGGPEPLGIKGIPELVEVLAQLPRAHLVLAAARPTAHLEDQWRESRHRIRELVATAGVTERFHLTGAPYEAMADLYAGVDAFVLLSRVETFGRAWAEASACGLPVVGRDVGGASEVIEDGVTGYLVASPEEARERLADLLASASLRRRLGRAGAERVRRRFAAGPIIDRLLEEVETAADRLASDPLRRERGAATDRGETT